MPSLPPPTQLPTTPAVSGAGAVPSPFPGPPLARLRRLVLAISLVLLLLMPLGLAGCSSPGQPPQRVLLDALALQIQLTQESIARALDLEATGLPQVSRVRIEQQQALQIGAAPGLRLVGRFDWRLAGDPIRVDSPFEIYLQRGERAQSWRLARPSGPADPTDPTNQAWVTDPLPLPGSRPAA